MPSSLPPPKKLKTASTANVTTKSESQAIEKLEKVITAALANNASLNPLADLLHIASSSFDADIVLKAIFALYRLFTIAAQKGILTAQEDEDSGRRTVRAWVAARLDAFANLLCELLQDEEKMLRVSTLKILFSLLRQLSSSVSSTTSSSSSAPLQFDVPFFQKIIRALLLCPSSPRALRSSKRKHAKHAKPPTDAGNEIETDVKDLFIETWLNLYADIRWFFLRETATLLENATLVNTYSYLPANALSILEKLTGIPPASNSKSVAATSTPAEKNQFWIEVLNRKPKLRKKGKYTPSSDSEPEADDDNEDTADADDWRTFFDEPQPDTKKKGSATGGRRLYTLSIHAQLHTPAAHRAVFTRTWLALLPLLSRGGDVFLSSTSSPSQKSSEAEDKQDGLVLVARALVVLHHGVIPHLTRAVLIMDWVGSCVDHGGHVGLLALNALFVLMREYNLDYPSFYTRLYAFLDRTVLHTQHRARFFRLTELFLSSSHLPSTLLASFAKRLARLALNAPPAGVIISIPFIYNILKRHPALMCMVHRVPENDSENIDPFDMKEPNPTLTHALDSSLWELAALRKHYHAPAATLARIFEEAFTRPNFAMEDFLDHTYSTLFETEANRKIKKEPVVLEEELERSRPMVIRSSRSKDSESVIQTDIVSEMWVFG